MDAKSCGMTASAMQAGVPIQEGSDESLTLHTKVATKAGLARLLEGARRSHR